MCIYVGYSSCSITIPIKLRKLLVINPLGYGYVMVSWNVLEVLKNEIVAAHIVPVSSNVTTQQSASPFKIFVMLKMIVLSMMTRTFVIINSLPVQTNSM